MPHEPCFYLHQKADSDLENIFDYSVANFGYARAEKYIYDIERVFILLAANPEMGQCFDPDSATLLQYPVGSHRIFFAQTDRGIEIFRILHQSMVPDLHL